MAKDSRNTRRPVGRTHCDRGEDLPAPSQPPRSLQRGSNPDRARHQRKVELWEPPELIDDDEPEPEYGDFWVEPPEDDE